MLRRAWLRLRSMLFRRRLEREMQEEMSGHLELAIARLMERGLSAEEARYAALREFGNVARLQEDARDARGARWLDALAGDLRFACRHFARTPGTALVMVIVLIGGLTISTLLFTFVHAYANNPPPGVELADDLVRIRGSLDAGEDGRGYRLFSEEEFLELRGLDGHFESIAGWMDANVILGTVDDAERRTQEGRVALVTENWFSVLDVRSTLGPGLPPVESGDPSRAAVAVIGHIAWAELFGMSPAVTGSTFLVNGHPVTVVGVAPRAFTGFPGYNRFQIWMPLSARHLILAHPSGSFRMVARLRDGVSMRAATSAVEAVTARVADANPELAELGPSADVAPLLSANSDPMFDRDVRLMWLTVGFLGLLVLLIACTNVSALLTGLATARRQEIAIRLSLGAARARLVRQLLTESALLAIFAGAVSLLLVWLVLRAAMRMLPGMPFTIGITWPIVVFSFGIALAVGVLFGLSPALHATRLALASVLRDSAANATAARGRLQRGLVVAQIAFTQPLIVMLVAVLVFLVRDFDPHMQSDYADQVVTVGLRRVTTATGSTADEAGAAHFRASFERLRAKLESTPGVRAVAIGPGHGWDDRPYVAHPDDAVGRGSGSAVRVAAMEATERYFEVMGIPLLRGRLFAPPDMSTLESRRSQMPVIVGSELARRLWGAADPLGRRLLSAVDTASTPRTLVVVGVVDDPRARSRDRDDAHLIYVPPAPRPAGEGPVTAIASGLLVRTAGAGASLIPALREIARAETPDMSATIRTLGEIQDENARRWRMITSGLVSAGVIALFLSAIGLYAVVAFAVGRRTREIAVRMAVGARGGQIVHAFVRDGLRLGAIGLAFGLPASLAGLRALMSIDNDIPQVELTPVTLIAAAGVILMAALASWIPARRAARVDPAVTLRHE